MLDGVQGAHAFLELRFAQIQSFGQRGPVFGFPLIGHILLEDHTRTAVNGQAISLVACRTAGLVGQGFERGLALRLRV